MNILAALLIFLHFGYHLAATAIGIKSFLHSNKHKYSIWNLVLSIVWFILSIFMLFPVLHTYIHHEPHTENCLESVK